MTWGPQHSPGGDGSQAVRAPHEPKKAAETPDMALKPLTRSSAATAQALDRSRKNKTKGLRITRIKPISLIAPRSHTPPLARSPDEFVQRPPDASAFMRQLNAMGVPLSKGHSGSLGIERSRNEDDPRHQFHSSNP